MAGIYKSSKLEFLLGFHKLGYAHPKNYIALVLKRYIWLNKFRNGLLTVNGFMGLLKAYVIDLKIISDIKKEIIDITEWNTIIESLEI